MLEFGREFAKSIKSTPKVIELIGDVGAGKTTFTRGLAEGLGVINEVTSPSFTISKNYVTKDNKNLIHYDFYRLKDVGLMADNLNENLQDKNAIIVVEWGESVKNILPKAHTTITIKLEENGDRSVTVENQDLSLDFTEEKPENLSPLAVNTAGDLTDAELYLDTSTPTTILKINQKTYKWDSGRELAEGLLKFIHEKLKENNKDFKDITKITFMSGPGSFTGLRIGAAVINTLAHELDVPLYDHKGNRHPIIIPDYGHGANITKPVK